MFLEVLVRCGLEFIRATIYIIIAIKPYLKQLRLLIFKITQKYSPSKHVLLRLSLCNQIKIALHKDAMTVSVII